MRHSEDKRDIGDQRTLLESVVAAQLFITTSWSFLREFSTIAISGDGATDWESNSFGEVITDAQLNASVRRRDSGSALPACQSDPVRRLARAPASRPQATVRKNGPG